MDCYTSRKIEEIQRLTEELEAARSLIAGLMIGNPRYLRGLIGDLYGRKAIEALRAKSPLTLRQCKEVIEAVYGLKKFVGTCYSCGGSCYGPIKDNPERYGVCADCGMSDTF